MTTLTITALTDKHPEWTAEQWKKHLSCGEVCMLIRVKAVKKDGEAKPMREFGTS